MSRGAAKPSKSRDSEQLKSGSKYLAAKEEADTQGVQTKLIRMKSGDLSKETQGRVGEESLSIESCCSTVTWHNRWNLSVDSLAEELVKLTSQRLLLLPGIRAELESAKEKALGCARAYGRNVDEELEELRADIVDLKEMYREQVNLLVNKIQTSSSMGTA
ncbi:Golgin candidate 5, partial [Cucurbita argyrosperma subsp. argyrosperma]